MSIVKARRFHEVVIVDATYKTNAYKMPFVNIVSIGNVGVKSLKTFAIAGAWISDETLATYKWVFGSLRSIIYDPASVQPGVIVMDSSAAELGAVATEFPYSKQLLCAMHIRDNLKRKCLKGFDLEEQHSALMESVTAMINSKDEDEFEKAVEDFKSIAFFSRKGSEIVEYLELLVSWT